MGKSNEWPDNYGHVYLCLEAAFALHAGTGVITVMISNAHTTEPAVRRWKTPRGIPTESQVRDLAHFIADAVSVNTVAFCGAQSELPIG